MTSLLELLATNAINWDIGDTLPLGPKSLKVKHQAFPHDGSRGLKRPTPASPPVTDNLHPWLEPRTQWMGQVGLRISWLTRGLPNSVLIAYSGAFSSQNCTVLGATGKETTKRFTQALLCCWDGQILSHQFLVVPECPVPLMGRDIHTKLGSTLVMGSFSAPRAL